MPPPTDKKSKKEKPDKADKEKKPKKPKKVKGLHGHISALDSASDPATITVVMVGKDKTPKTYNVDANCEVFLNRAKAAFTDLQFEDNVFLTLDVTDGDVLMIDARRDVEEEEPSPV